MWTEQTIGHSVNLPSVLGKKFSHLRKTKAFSVGEDAGVSWKAFAAWSFLLSFIASYKNYPFLILYEKYRISLYTASLIRNSAAHMSLAIDLIDSLGSLTIIALIMPTNSRVLFSSERAEWCFRAAVSSLSSLNSSNTFRIPCDWHRSTQIFVLKVPAWIPTVSKFLEEGIAWWYCFPRWHYQTESCLLHSRQNLNQTKCMCETDNLK